MGPPGPPGLMGPIGPPGHNGTTMCLNAAGPLKHPRTVELNGAYCPKGYSKLRGTCYKAFSFSANFGDSVLHCRLDGGTLAMPRDADTNNFLIYLKNSVNKDSYFWFGLHDQPREGSFEWIDGSALVVESYTSWAPGEPNTQDEKEDCANYFNSNNEAANKWNDDNCNKPFPFICQVDIGRP
ncbi:hypothetical protein Bbelb_054030 [Branchiostoma belcheri]|nr:hypothetical protein Bbelb_054030 [Branchiostoma belcheri]